MNSTTILTANGNELDFLNVTPDDIDWRDIVWALPHIPRFNGHLVYPINVAYHSIVGAALIDPQFELHFLLHDAAEAYTGDIPAPLKAAVPEFKERVERPILEAILIRAGLDPELPGEIKDVDIKLMATEAAQYHTPGFLEQTGFPVEPYPMTLLPMDSMMSRRRYVQLLSKYIEIGW